MPQVVAARFRIVRGVRRIERRRNVLVAARVHGLGKGRVHLPEIRLQPRADAFQPGHPAHCRIVRLRVADNQRGLVERRVIGRGNGGKFRLAELDNLPADGPVPPGPENCLAHAKSLLIHAVAIRKPLTRQRLPLPSGLAEEKGGVFERALEKAAGRLMPVTLPAPPPRMCSKTFLNGISGTEPALPERREGGKEKRDCGAHNQTDSARWS